MGRRVVDDPLLAIGHALRDLDDRLPSVLLVEELQGDRHALRRLVVVDAPRLDAEYNRREVIAEGRDDVGTYLILEDALQVGLVVDIEGAVVAPDHTAEPLDSISRVGWVLAEISEADLVVLDARVVEGAGALVEEELDVLPHEDRVGRVAVEVIVLLDELEGRRAVDAREDARTFSIRVVEIVSLGVGARRGRGIDARDGDGLLPARGEADVGLDLEEASVTGAVARKLGLNRDQIGAREASVLLRVAALDDGRERVEVVVVVGVGPYGRPGIDDEGLVPLAEVSLERFAQGPKRRRVRCDDHHLEGKPEGPPAFLDDVGAVELVGIRGAPDRGAAV